MTIRTTQALVLVLAALSLALGGCAHRLRGPIHAADGPAYVAPSTTRAPSDPSRIPSIDVDHRVVLIGDAGYYLADDPTLAALGAWAAAVESSTVVFLGDNIYNEGLTDEDRERGEQILGQQLAATDAPKVVIPGNHDWGLLPKNYNRQAILNQQAFVEDWPQGRSAFIPRDGCMGPVERILDEGDGDHRPVVLIALDPTPWIRERLRAECPQPMSLDEHLATLGALLAEHRDAHLLVASHYPMLTGGPHGGLTYGFFVDAIVTPLGWMMGGLLNTYEDEYADWIARTQAVLRRHPPTIYAAGHDHNLQLLEAGDVAGLYVVSGAGARERVSTVTHLPETIFAHAAEGFVVVDFGRRPLDASRSADPTPAESAVVVRVIEPVVSPHEPVFEMELR